MTWTRETMYRQPERWDDSVPVVDVTELRAQVVCRHVHRWTPEFARTLLDETEWIPVGQNPAQEPVFRPEQDLLVEAIATGFIPCPECRGALCVRARHRGRDTGIEIDKPVPCVCRMYMNFWSIWRDVPERFQNVRFETLEARASMGMPLMRQQEIIDMLKAHPEDSFFLFGHPGTGKSHLSTALYRMAVERSVIEQFRKGNFIRSVWRVTASVMIDEKRAWDLRPKDNPEDQTPAPTVDREPIMAAIRGGYRPVLFLDELDKVQAKEYQIETLTKIVNYVYEANGQIVATANKGQAALSAKWGEDTATLILRRCGGDAGAHTIAFLPGNADIEVPIVPNIPASEQARVPHFDVLDEDKEAVSAPETTPAAAPAARKTTYAATESGSGVRHGLVTPNLERKPKRS